MATLHQASLSVSVFQEHLLTLCLCHILVTCALFQTFSLLWYCYGIFDLCCCCNCLGAPWTILYIAAAAKSLHSCLTLWPRRWQPIRLPHPWDSSGKNTGVGCHFLLQRMKVKSASEVAQLCLTLSNPMDWSLPGSSVHGIFQASILEWVAISFSNTIYWQP